jgi:non-ribosomal peptide synthetase component E (peptide arylation enzyme)
MGRSSALKYADITCQFPEVHPVLKGLTEIARIAEINAEEMYLRKSDSLQLLYIAAERTYVQLRHFAERAGIATMDVDDRVKQYGDVPALHLHNGGLEMNTTCVVAC